MNDKAYEKKKQRIIKNGTTALSKYQKKHDVDIESVDIRHLKIQTAHPLLRILIGGIGVSLIGLGIWGILGDR